MSTGRLRLTVLVLMFGIAGERVVAQTPYTVSAESALEAVPQKKLPLQQGAKEVTLIVQDSSIDYIIRRLGKQADRPVVFDATDPKFGRRISVRIVKSSIMEAFSTALQGTGLTARLAEDGRTVVVRTADAVKPENETIKRGSGTIHGRVTDSVSGAGLEGVTVTVLGTGTSAVTQQTGAFRIANVPSGEQRVLIKLFGYRSVDRVVMVPDSGGVPLRVVMVSIPTTLSGVVTTATGQQRRVEMGNDITKINADSIMNIAPVATVTDLLATRVPGLIVMPTSGLPGAPSRIRLRGTSSLSTSNDPIVFVDGVRIYADQSGDKLAGVRVGAAQVDGVANSGTTAAGGRYRGPSPIDQLDPNSIETIEVFKGPSASALYGPDAANGVIVITTKRGRTGPTRVIVAANSGLSALPGKWPVNYYRFGHVYRSGSGTGVPTSGGSHLCLPFELCVTDSLIGFQAMNEKRFSLLETGTNQDVTMTVSGGTAAMTYSLTGSAASQNGMMRLPDIEIERFRITNGSDAPGWMKQPDQYATYSGTSKLDMRIGQNGNVTLTNILFRSEQQQPPDLETAVQALSTRYLDPTSPEMPPQLYGFKTRVLLKSLRSTNSVDIRVQPASWLPLTVHAGIDLSSTHNSNVLPRGYSVPSVAGVGVIGLYEGDSTGDYRLSRSTSSIRTLSASTTVPLPHTQIAVGFNYAGISNSGYVAGTQGLPLGVLEPTQFIYKEGTGPTQTTLNRSTFGWYIAPMFNLSSKLFFNPGIRIDGSSAAGSRAALSTLPKLDFSWLALDRSGQPPLFGVLSQLRPRVAFGIAGVQPGVANSFRLFRPFTVVPTGEMVSLPGVALSTMGNTKLRPERSREFEGGLDGDLWNSRVLFTVSGYHKMRYDAIVVFPLSPSAGGDNIAANVGSIRNRGINASIDARILDSRMVGWSIGGDLTRNRGMVMSLVEGEEQIVVGGGPDGQGLIVYKPGYPPNSVFVPKIASYFDANQDGLISGSEIRMSNDSAYMGAQEPTEELNFRTTLALFNGRIQLNTTVTYQNGLTQYNQVGIRDINRLNDPSIPPARQAEIAAACEGAQCVTNGTSKAISSIGAYQAVNLLRWNTLSVSYYLPLSIAKRIGGSALAVTLLGKNLGLHTNYRGKDPSVSAYASGNLVSDSGQLPAPRVFQVRVKWDR